MDFCTAYNWLMAHPGFGRFGICIDVDVVKVDPTTETIEKDESRNTATRVWLETGQWTSVEIPPTIPFSTPVPPPTRKLSFSSRISSKPSTVTMSPLQ